MLMTLVPVSRDYTKYAGKLRAEYEDVLGSTSATGATLHSQIMML